VSDPIRDQFDKDEAEAMVSGLDDVAAGRARPLADIRAELSGQERWCINCRRPHQPTAEHPLCPLCSACHETFPSDLYFDHRGWRFRAPFVCMGCGIEVCPHQWAFSRSCGGCDMSVSKTRRLMFRAFVGPHEFIGPRDSLCLDESRFVDPAEKAGFPVLYERSPWTTPWPQPPRRPNPKRRTG
jgi:hypothetical protein